MQLAGFNFPYFLHMPKATPTDQPVRLFVEPNNTGTSSDDFKVHRERARRLASSGYPKRFADKLSVPLLIPVFPRPQRIWRAYTHALDRDTLLIEEEPLKRIDLQLIAMIKHARNVLKEKGIQTKPKVYMHGFSASGNFVNRFAALHPEIVRAVATGAVNGLPICPISTLKSTKLPYPLGVGDLKEVADIEFDLEAYRGVSQFIYMGYLDRNDTLPYGDAWNDDERQLIKDLLGQKMMPDRWERSQKILSDLNLSVQCVTYNGTAHRIRREMRDDILAFFQANDGDAHVEIQPRYNRKLWI